MPRTSAAGQPPALVVTYLTPRSVTCRAPEQAQSTFKVWLPHAAHGLVHGGCVRFALTLIAFGSTVAAASAASGDTVTPAVATKLDVATAAAARGRKEPNSRRDDGACSVIDGASALVPLASARNKATRRTMMNPGHDFTVLPRVHYCDVAARRFSLLSRSLECRSANCLCALTALRPPGPMCGCLVGGGAS